jgi:hypothetical protein
MSCDIVWTSLKQMSLYLFNLTCNALDDTYREEEDEKTRAFRCFGEAKDDDDCEGREQIESMHQEVLTLLLSWIHTRNVSFNGHLNGDVY